MITLLDNAIQLTGPIPTEIFKLSHLENFEVPRNNFTGTFPTQLLNLPYLRAIDLGFNQLKGPIPTEPFGFSSQLFIAGNSFTGTIPTEVGIYQGTYLSLGKNKLIGTLPAELYLAENLSSLDLQDNAVSS